MGRVWLVDYAEDGRGRSIWRRIVPRAYCVGETVADEVWLLELPFGEGDKRTVGWLSRRLRRTEKREGGELRLGMPLVLAAEMERVYPQVLADGRRLACRRLVRRLESDLGGLCGVEVGILGLDEHWQAELVHELLRCGARVAASGGFAERLAADYWERGVALPILSERKLVEVCRRVIVMRDVGVGQSGGKPIFFRELPVFVSGRFHGRFSFGMFPSGMAAAIIGDTENE